MTNKTSINKICIVGGTHGNELSGVQAVSNWMRCSDELLQNIDDSISLKFHLANQAAINARVRYLEEDLNRQFSPQILGKNRLVDTTLLSKEANLAAEFNTKYGPKSESKTDLIVDIHNTTSNMGPSLIILENDDFHRQLARYVKQNMPESNILVEDYQDYGQFGYLCTVAKRGLMIELGPQAHSTLNANIYQQAKTLCKCILDFVSLYNQGSVIELPPVEAFRLGKEISYPVEKCEQTNSLCKSAMIHPSLQNQDYCQLKKGAPCFIDFDGKEITWQENDTYPHFIGEAAYDHLHIAFATSDKILF